VVSGTSDAVDAAAGKMDVVSDTVSELTGHQPQTLVDFLRRHPESYQHCSSLNLFQRSPS
jgi:hypothetical protein